ncbi:BEL1-like homeodomain protein 10 [Brassica napus]|uniref:BEL1-like homeodomain protein 10 n=1 Tax=Brassica napus TaxID=3708 RepID=UPI0020785F4B|nr:BEL1-like homeodomain protein 10 [Brassica napus]
MAVYYPSNVNCYQQEPIYLNHHHHQQQQQPSSSSAAAAAASFVGGEENVRNEMVFIPPTGLQNLNGDVPVSSSELTFRDGQGLSLSLLGTQISLPSFHYHQYSSISAKETPPFNKEMLLLGQSDPSSGYAGVYNSYNMSSVLRSRYLKPAQGLLDEVVSVEKEMNQLRKKKKGEDFNNSAKETEGGGGIGGEISIELSTIERQELRSKKDKLLTMLDEVDKRYNQYYHQMEALASSFEVVAGFGSPKPYTSVALNRISCHFRALRDAIKEQIKMIREKLGEKGGELSLDEQQGGERIPRLRYLDQRLRQQRALHQQLGMVRPCWRPQRGLPESSVSALRAWLFEHFLHPYPKESEKMMLAKQTGLSKNQVANWFINARVRLWKPMIEEMYKEEFGDDASELLTSKSPNSTNQEDSSSQQQQQQENTTNVAFSSEPKPDCTQANEDDPQLHQMNRSGDYDTLMNYQGYDYRYIDGNNQQESRFSSGQHLHDFVV